MSTLTLWELDVFAVTSALVIAVASIIASSRSPACRLALVESLQTCASRRYRHTNAELDLRAFVGGRSIFGAVDGLSDTVAKCKTRTVVAAVAGNAAILAVGRMQLVVTIAPVFAGVVAVALLLAGADARPTDHAWVRYTHYCNVVVQWLCTKISNGFGDLANYQPSLFWVGSRTGVSAVAWDLTTNASFVMERDRATAVIAALARIGTCLLTFPDADLAPDTRTWWR
jgi:hypothetical protein